MIHLRMVDLHQMEEIFTAGGYNGGSRISLGLASWHQQ